MKRIQRTAALLLALLLVLATFSATALATDYEVVTLKKGSWINLPSNNNNNTLYKLDLSADSIITVSWKGNDNNIYRYIQSYADAKGENSVFHCDMDQKTSGTKAYCIAKGTYYFYMYEGSSNPTGKVKVTVQKPVNQGNYCKAKAIALKQKATVKIAQTPNYSYARWYKITLNKKKVVTITTNDNMANNITLYKGNRKIKCTSGDRTVISEDALDKGTYYIRVAANDFVFYGNEEYCGNYITVSWK